MGIEIDPDEADVLVLTQGLERSSQLTFAIKRSLKSIAATSGQSSELFTPILSRNNVLTTLQRNIDSTLNAVSSVKDLANEASRYEIILLKGVAEAGLKKYTSAISRLHDMLIAMESGKTLERDRNAEFQGIVSHLREVITSGENELRIYFVSILRTIKPFDPQINMNKKIPFPYYHDQQLQELSWVLNYYQSAWEDSTLLENAFIQERSHLNTKSMAYLEPFTKQIVSNKKVPYEKGSSGINSYTAALLGFIANEKSLVDDLFAKYPELSPRIYSAILTPLLSSFSKILNSCLQSTQEDFDNMGLFAFEIVENINNIKRALKGKGLPRYSFFEDSIGEANKVTQLLFSKTIQRISDKCQQISALPTDNGVAEASVDTMSRLRRYSEFRTGFLSAMESVSREAWLPHNYKEKEYTYSPNITNLKDSAALLSCFISDCIDTLAIGLERRAQNILSPSIEPDVANPNSTRNKQKQRVGFYLLSNLILVEEIVVKSDLSLMLGEEGKGRLEKLKKRYVSYVVYDWRMLTSNLMDSIVIDNSGKKSKDKEQIKEKFRKFNEGFETLVNNTKPYKLSEPAIKSSLKSEITALVLPMYQRFYTRYKDSFKNPKKHILYTPDEVTSAINHLFK